MLTFLQRVAQGQLAAEEAAIQLREVASGYQQVLLVLYWCPALHHDLSTTFNLSKDNINHFELVLLLYTLQQSPCLAVRLGIIYIC